MFVVDEASLRRSAKRYCEILEANEGDFDKMLEAERVDAAALGDCLGDLAHQRGYDQETHLGCMLECFLLGLGAGRRESSVADGGMMGLL